MSDSINEEIAKAKGWQDIINSEGGVFEKFSMLPKKNWQNSIADAWELVEELASMKNEWAIQLSGDGAESHRYSCFFTDLPSNSPTAYAPTAAEAICLAYLSLQGADDENG